MTNLLNHNQLKKQRDICRRIDPLIASNDGYLLTQDGRIALRMGVGKRPVMFWRSETKDLGLDTEGLTPEEAYALAGRFVDLPAVEDAALTHQRDVARLRKALQTLFTQASTTTGSNPALAKALVEAAIVLRDTE